MPRFSRPGVVRACLVGVALVAGACGGGDGDDAELGEPLTSDRPTTSVAAEGTAAEMTTTTAAPAGTVVEVRVVRGAPEGGVQRAAVRLGETVTLRVSSDTPDRVHVHGYDIEFDVGPGVPGETGFDATIPGVFEVELHESGREIVKLEVRP